MMNSTMSLRYVRVVFEDEHYFFECPHCGGGVQVAKNEVNCQIFRHAVYAKTGRQINPHTAKGECDRLFERGEVVGCARPFRFHFGGSDGDYVTPCDYI